MEDSKYSDLLKRIRNGEEVPCPKCKKGIIRPFNPDYKVNHAFICDFCKKGLMITP